MEFESHSLSSASGDFKSEIVSLVGDSEMEGLSGDSLLNEAPSRDPSEALFSKKNDGDESFIDKLLPPSILTKDEINVACQRREHTDNLVRLYM